MSVDAVGEHWGQNIAAAMLLATCSGISAEDAAEALSGYTPPEGRGQAEWLALPEDGKALLVDDAYNANPESMRAALAGFAQRPANRHLIALGEMKELGPDADKLHADLAPQIIACNPAIVFLAGDGIKPLAEALEGKVKTEWSPNAAGLQQMVNKLLTDGDALLIKGRMLPVCVHWQMRYGPGAKRRPCQKWIARTADALRDPVQSCREVHRTERDELCHVPRRTRVCDRVRALPSDWRSNDQLAAQAPEESQPIREDGPESHLLTKKGTPTMGGFLILIGISIGTLLWADLSNEYVWIVLFVTVGYGLIGFLDDFTKVTKGHAGGLSGKARLGAEFVIATVAVVWVTRYAPIAATESALLRESAGLLPVPIPEGFETSLTFPFFKDVLINLTIYGFAMFGSLVIVGAANSVNLTDGLDGLAIVPVMIAGGTFAIIAYICGTPRYAEYLYLINTPGTTELTVLFGALFGSGLGFLWYNAPPAKVFMGDTGSLALGGTVGSVAVCTKHEIVLAIVGGLFVLEALSVIVQVASFKLTGKRVFKMAPIHHHYEKLDGLSPQL